ncbi:MarR family winged helix-turn-helix transcriptional regulator [Streptomyces sp. MBT62]|uniref:MarR family winged helix-turn-helix transcriptional regulator n=1 Tax=Streptomyces sp. MBT62 TaxID=2800410 RepID=UPI0019091BD8|nr:MarR family winged helix-turn-helix transcriptional regulator [Streptomyces sp. MBT62]MBK3568806.1 winged helix-turn-helix transcriptional regulator [Streptomyces sp. MBT62]
MTTATEATTPPADARMLGLAHYAARAVLESVLVRHGVGFHQQITLRPVAVAAGPVDRGQLAADTAAALKVDEDSAQGTIDELITAGLLGADASDVRITDAGRELFERITKETSAASARIWGDLPEEDLLAAGRVLSLVTERANAELATVTG